MQDFAQGIIHSIGWTTGYTGVSSVRIIELKELCPSRIGFPWEEKDEGDTFE